MPTHDIIDNRNEILVDYINRILQVPLTHSNSGIFP